MPANTAAGRLRPVTLAYLTRESILNIGENSNLYGIDGWGDRTWTQLHTQGTTARQFAGQDSNADAQISPTNCGWPNSQIAVRRWELGGEKAGAGLDTDPFVRANALFKGWEGGTGNFDCEPLAWNDNYPEHPWGNYFSISIG